MSQDISSKHEAGADYPMTGATEMGDARGNILASRGGGSAVRAAIVKLAEQAGAALLDYTASNNIGPQAVYFVEERVDQAYGSLDAKTGLRITAHRHDLTNLVIAFCNYSNDPYNEKNIQQLLAAGEFLTKLPTRGYTHTQQTLPPVSDHERKQLEQQQQQQQQQQTPRLHSGQHESNH